MIILGCGNMGTAFAKRLSINHEIGLFDRNFHKAEKLATEYCGHAFANIKEALDWADAIILAVKPQNLSAAAPLINDSAKDKQMLFSLLAGITLETLSHHFPRCQIVRLMPNLAVGHGDGLIGMATQKEVGQSEMDALAKLFEPLGKVFWLPEEKFNAFIALGGSGPAFMFVLIEAMVDAGISMGLNVHEAQLIIHQMIKGSLTMLDETEKHPGKLKWEVASPGGTTIAGLKIMEEEAMRSSMIKTFWAAYTMAKEMDLKTKQN